MNEYDQERLTEMAEELDAAKERIRCLEAELADVKRELSEFTECAKDLYLMTVKP
jgi:prefoldin subunit 5